MENGGRLSCFVSRATLYRVMILLSITITIVFLFCQPAGDNQTAADEAGIFQDPWDESIVRYFPRAGFKAGREGG